MRERCVFLRNRTENRDKIVLGMFLFENKYVENGKNALKSCLPAPTGRPIGLHSKKF